MEIDVWKIVYEFEEVLKKAGWEVFVQAESMFSKPQWKSGHINIGKYRQGVNQIEIVYFGSVPSVENKKTRVRLLWNLSKLTLEEMQSSRVQLYSEVDIPEVAAEYCRKYLLSHWKALERETRTSLRILESYKKSIALIPSADIAKMRGRRSGKKFNF